MKSVNQLINDIESLPDKYVQEVIDFVGYLKLKQKKDIPETMIMSEESLAEYWDSEEENEAWQDL